MQFPINFTPNGDTTSAAIRKIIREFEYLYNEFLDRLSRMEKPENVQEGDIWWDGNRFVVQEGGNVVPLIKLTDTGAPVNTLKADDDGLLTAKRMLEAMKKFFTLDECKATTSTAGVVRLASSSSDTYGVPDVGTANSIAENKAIGIINNPYTTVEKARSLANGIIINGVSANAGSNITIALTTMEVGSGNYFPIGSVRMTYATSTSFNPTPPNPSTQGMPGLWDPRGTMSFITSDNNGTVYHASTIWQKVK